MQGHGGLDRLDDGLAGLNAKWVMSCPPDWLTARPKHSTAWTHLVSGRAKIHGSRAGSFRAGQIFMQGWDAAGTPAVG
jgi:hypothetical protein